ncbi:helitron_like_N domain-containing protein [Trichonephila clavata]|uniref:Helitron_like_N domain-containing protein n=1 Tax=Trichonephila clavata TaxID=2740835 RepID=A0A8X6G8T8_TRICU|nr:helitron_like_N domain-containing protein [Trichonephila clavata]
MCVKTPWMLKAELPSDLKQTMNGKIVWRAEFEQRSEGGSPRHMHEYAQDAIAYVRLYGCPDLFITFTCNPAWDDIQQLLFHGQSPVDRHDITARVFRQKLKSLMDFMVKHEVFGSVRCWMYSVEWQKKRIATCTYINLAS